MSPIGREGVTTVSETALEATTEIVELAGRESGMSVPHSVSEATATMSEAAQPGFRAARAIVVHHSTGLQINDTVTATATWVDSGSTSEPLMVGQIEGKYSLGFAERREATDEALLHRRVRGKSRDIARVLVRAPGALEGLLMLSQMGSATIKQVAEEAIPPGRTLEALEQLRRCELVTVVGERVYVSPLGKLAVERLRRSYR